MKRIVIADDSSTARMILKRCLQIAGIGDVEIVEAANGAEALEALRDAPTDLLLTDLNMPVLDGGSLLKIVKTDLNTKATEVLVISSASNPAKEEELMALGAKAVLPKPISPPMVAQAIADLLPEEQEGDDAW